MIRCTLKYFYSIRDKCLSSGTLSLVLLFVAARLVAADDPPDSRETANRQQLAAARNQLWDEARAHSKKGDFKKAIAIGERLLFAEEQLSETNYTEHAETLWWLSTQCLKSDCTDDAIRWAARRLAVFERLCGLHSWQSVTARWDLDAQRCFAKCDAQQRKRLWELEDEFDRDVAEFKPLDAVKVTTELIRVEELLLGDHPHLANSLERRSGCWFAIRRFDAAMADLQRVVKIREQALGPEHPDIALALNNMGLHYAAQRDFARATPLYERAIKIRETSLGLKHPDVSVSLNNLAQVYETQANYPAAEPLYARALKIRENAFGPNHPDVAASLNNLAMLYTTQAKYSLAEPLQRRALESSEIAYGSEHRETATSISNLATFYKTIGKFAVAEPLYVRALKIFEKTRGIDHPDTVTCADLLAELHRSIGDYAAAEPLLKRALKSRERTFGRNHSDTAISLDNLAGLYTAMGNYAAADPLYREALRIREEADGLNHPNTASTLIHLAEVHRSLGDYAAAESLQKRALAIRKMAFGPEHPETAICLNNIAAIYKAQANHPAAEALYREALRIIEKSLGSNHPSTAYCLNNLALILKSQGNHKGAEALLARALKIRETSLGAEHPLTLATRSNLGVLYCEQGDFIAAEPIFRQVIASEEERLGPGHPSTAISLISLAAQYWWQGKPLLALPEIARALDTSFQSFQQTATIQTEHQQFLMIASISHYMNLWLTVSSKEASLTDDTWSRVLLWKGLITARQIGLRQALKGDPLFAEFQQITEQLSTVTLNPPSPPSTPDAVRSYNETEAERQHQWQLHKMRLEADHERLERELARKSAEFRKDERRRAINSKDILASLKKAPKPTALVDLLQYNYINGDFQKANEWRIAAFVIRPDQPTRRIELGPAERVNDAVNRWRQVYGRTAVGRDTGQELRELIWEPLKPYLDGIEIILISPDRQLAQLPWGALPGDRTDTFLLEDLAIAVIPTPQLIPDLLHQEPPRRRLPSSVLIVGNIDYASPAGAAHDQVIVRAAQGRTRDGRFNQFKQLAAASPEVKAIDEQFRNQARQERLLVLEGTAASEAQFREAGPRHEWLHLITHGYFAPAEISKLLNQHSVDVLRGHDDQELGVPSIETAVVPGGLGIKLIVRDGRYLIEAVLPDGAAGTDGRLRVNDEVLAIAQQYEQLQSVSGRKLEQVLELIRGPVGTIIRLRVRPNTNQDKEIEIAIARTPISQQPVPRVPLNPALLSGLAFAGANRPPESGKDDGILTALEVSALDLSRVDTVVLSACETGLGEVAGGEGLLGLQRAFQVAGAKTVVASLWKVDDQATQLLMKEFYTNLWERKLGKLESLRQAQVKLLREGVTWKDPATSRGLSIQEGQPPLEGRRLPPFYWAAFVLSGDWR